MNTAQCGLPMFSASLPAHLQEQIVEIDISTVQPEHLLDANTCIHERAGQHMRSRLRRPLGPERDQLPELVVRKHLHDPFLGALGGEDQRLTQMPLGVKPREERIEGP